MTAGAGIRNASCPGCGGVLDLTRGNSVLTCGFCGGQFFSEEHREPCYLIRPAIDAHRASEKVHRAIRSAGAALRREGAAFALDEGFAHSATLAGTTLYFIPYFRYSAFRVGTAPCKEDSDVKSHVTVVGDEERGPVTLTRQVEICYKLESKVVVSEVGLVIPAVDAGGRRSLQWGIPDLLNEAAFTAGSNLPLTPFDREAAEREGTVLNPFRSCSDVMARCREMYRSRRKKTRLEVEGVPSALPPGLTAERERSLENLPRLGIFHTLTMDHDEIDYETDNVDERVMLYYAPLWKVTVRYGGRTWDAYVDAIRGRIMSLEAPVGSAPPPLRLMASALALGQFGGLGLWASSGAPPHVQGLVGLAVLGMGVWLFRECLRLKGEEISTVKVLGHEHFQD